MVRIDILSQALKDFSWNHPIYSASEIWIFQSLLSPTANVAVAVVVAIAVKLFNFLLYSIAVQSADSIKINLSDSIRNCA